MLMLSKNFTAEEFYRSPTAMRHGINNEPNAEVVSNLIDLVDNLLQPLRDKLGKPVKILSGYRSPELNKIVGGAVNSDHLYGKAADIGVTGMDNKELFFFIKNNFKFTKLILEFYDEANPANSWNHLSFDKNYLKNQCFLARKDANGKTRYIPYL